jgi:hypothetical protein
MEAVEQLDGEVFVADWEGDLVESNCPSYPDL